MTTFMERNDVIWGEDLYASPSRRAIPPFAETQSDYEIFSGLATRLGVLEPFAEYRDEMQWLEEIYAESRGNALEVGVELPPFDQFWNGDGIAAKGEPRAFPIERFRRDPVRYPLGTPSGKIEFISDAIASFGYPDAPGHPTWLDKNEVLGSARSVRFPLHLISPQPKNKLHSQFDFGRHSRKDKIHEREAIRINPVDAARRHLRDGHVVSVFNDRGACLVGVVITDQIMPGVVQLPTGAWFDPDDGEGSAGLERHGNPNVLTRDQGSSSLAQGPTAHSCLVEIESYDGPLPDMKAFTSPEILAGVDP